MLYGGGPVIVKANNKREARSQMSRGTQQQTETIEDGLDDWSLNKSIEFENVLKDAEK